MSRLITSCRDFAIDQIAGKNCRRAQKPGNSWRGNCLAFHGQNHRGTSRFGKYFWALTRKISEDMHRVEMTSKEFLEQMAAALLLPAQPEPDNVVVLFPGNTKAVTPVADRPPRRPPALKVDSCGARDYIFARR
jgi:hypothetical protein